MSTLSANPTPLPPSDPAPVVKAPLRRSWFQNVLHDVLSRPGARIGAIWIAIVTFLAVFGPIIASSHPFYMKTADGTVSSPWWDHLTPTDLTLFIMTPVGIALAFFRTVPLGRRMMIFLAVFVVVMIVTSFTVHLPQAIDYSQYREQQATDKIETAWFAPLPYSPSDRLRDQPTARLQPPPYEGHPLGTETNGSDVLSIIIHASRIALTIGFISTGIAIVIGVVVGGLMGYFAKGFDLIGMRLVEIVEAIPQLYLLLTFAAFFPGNPEIFGIKVPRIYLMMAIIGVTGWTGYARYIRAEFLKLRKQDFVQAAVACGLPLRSILFKHMLPNGVAPVLVGASFGVASAILTESFLSFLGLGLIDEPSWGGLLKQSVSETGKFTWWIATFPGLAIFLTVFSYNLIGEALRDAIDPHTQRLNRAGG